MSTANLNPCPYCNPFDHELEFVEISTRNFESGIAVECMSCGCRSMAADKSDGEEMAASLWNSMSVSNVTLSKDDWEKVLLSLEINGSVNQTFRPTPLGPDLGWACGKCGCTNLKSDLLCGFCDTPRPRR